MATLPQLKQEVFDYVRYAMGDGMIDIDLDPEHYEQALKQALIKYRQRSSRSVEESYAFLDLRQDVNTYTLPQEVISVQQVFRRSIGSTTTSSSSQFEPFEAGFLNLYLLQSGRVGGFLNYELFAQFQELSARMFGGYMNFKFNPVSKELLLMRRPRADDETIMLWTHNYKPDITLLSDHMVLPWLRDYTLGMCKIMQGEARELFGNIPGPQGGSSLNGTALKAEGQAMLDKLEQDIANYIDGAYPMSFIVG